jgi:uncharacterized protein YoxC
MSYLKRKEEVFNGRQIPEEVGVVEKLMEDEIRKIIAPYAKLIQKLNKLVDTKKPETRDQLFKWILENPETMKELNKNVDKLINLVRC